MNILAIGSHPDDIELGCGGLLIKAARAGHSVYMYVATRGEASGDPQERCAELMQSAKLIGAKILWIDNFEDSKISVNGELMNHLEYFIQQVHPDLILTHPIADYHRDHRAVGKSTLEAARNNQNILAYEVPLTRDFKPQVFYDISNVIDDKRDLINIFESQKKKNFLNQNGIRGLHLYRAQQNRLNSSIEFAESFEVAKLCFSDDFSLLKLPMEETYSVKKKIDTKEIIEYVNDIPSDTVSTEKLNRLQEDISLQFTVNAVDTSNTMKSDHEKSLQLGSEWDSESIVKGIVNEYHIEGNSRRINGVSSIDDATEKDLTFCRWEGEKAISVIAKSKAGIMLCKKSIRGKIYPTSGCQYIFVDDPKFVFMRFVNSIKERREIREIASTAVIDETAKIGPNCSIGEHVKIGKNCQIGKNTIIFPGVTLVQDCIVGENCIIQSGATLGSEGFGFVRHVSGELEKFPQLKGLKIGNDVEIGVNCSIARGALTDTIIGNGTKIDSLVHIAHNVRIGNHCQLTAGTIIGGSAIIGNSCWTGLNSTIKNNINVGNNVLIAAGACVVRDVHDADVVAGIPAKSIKSKVSTEELFLMVGITNNDSLEENVVI